MAKQIEPSKLNFPQHLQAVSQEQSSFFKLSLELRDQIYALVLTSPQASNCWFNNSECECKPCQNRRLEPDELKPSQLPLSDAARTASFWPFLATCRRIYDEARPVLQQCNALWFDAKSWPYNILRRIAVSLSLHRGIRLSTLIATPPVLLACAFVFNLNSRSSHSPLQLFKRFHHAISGTTMHLQIRRLKVMIKLWCHLLIADYVPLLRGFENINGVKSCDINIIIGERMDSTEAENNVLRIIGEELQAAALGVRPSSPTLAVNSFPRAKAAAAAAAATEALDAKNFYSQNPDIVTFRESLLDGPDLQESPEDPIRHFNEVWDLARFAKTGDIDGILPTKASLQMDALIAENAQRTAAASRRLDAERVTKDWAETSGRAMLTPVPRRTPGSAAGSRWVDPRGGTLHFGLNPLPIRNARGQGYGDRGQDFRLGLGSPMHYNSSHGLQPTSHHRFPQPININNNARARVQPPRATSSTTHDFNPLAVDFVPGLTWMKHG